MGNDSALDLDFIAGSTPLLRNSGFRKAKSIASVDGVAVLHQPLLPATMEHQPSLSASVSPTAAATSHPPNALSRVLANTIGQLGHWGHAGQATLCPWESRRLVSSYVLQGICSTFVVTANTADTAAHPLTPRAAAAPT